MSHLPSVLSVQQLDLCVCQLLRCNAESKTAYVHVRVTVIHRHYFSERCLGSVFLPQNAS